MRHQSFWIQPVKQRICILTERSSINNYLVNFWHSLNELVNPWTFQNVHVTCGPIDFDLSLRVLTGRTRSHASTGMKLECTRVSSKSKTSVLIPRPDVYGGKRISSVTIFFTKFESLSSKWLTKLAMGALLLSKPVWLKRLRSQSAFKALYFSQIILLMRPFLKNLKQDFNFHFN